MQAGRVHVGIGSGLVAAVLGFAAATLGAHDPISTKVTWEREIGPLVQARCVSCHSPGGRAPMSLTTYEEARPWARAIREEVLTRRMPVWHVVRGYGDFSNDRSLSPFEVALFAAWADGGAPAFTKATAGKPEPAKATAGNAAESPDLKVGPTPAEGPDLKAGPTVGTTVGPIFRSGVTSTYLPCTARTLPAGRLVGLKPVLEKGADLRITITHADGTQEPLLWLRGFDPRFAETYWLRTPVDVTRATRVSTVGGAPCTLTVLFEAETTR